MLKKAFKKKWVAALRSGKFSQGQGMLKEKGADGKFYYCCLGVAMEVDKTLKRKRTGSCQILSDASIEKIGLSFTSMQKLANWNDLSGASWSFKKIASYIERYL